jgi:hypothetical protein
LDGQAEAGEQNMASVLDGDFVVVDIPEVTEEVDVETGEIVTQ